MQDPVTLPCGHSSCLQCIKDHISPKAVPPEGEVQPLPCLTHLPPRLPLSPMTVPCPVHGCPRSAIGRGIGAWAGHHPRYGLIPTYTERLPVGLQDVGSGAPPVDGFVMGVADHPLRLTVIGPQTRSKAHLFAVPPHGVEITTTGTGTQQQTASTLLPSLATSNMLRTDVTLSKAVAILFRYASSPLPRSPGQRRDRTSSGEPSSSSASRSRYLRRGYARNIRRDDNNSSTYPGSASRSNARTALRSRRFDHGRSDTHVGASRTSTAGTLSARRVSHRLGPSHAGMGIFGRHDSELESGTMGGVRAASESEDEAVLEESSSFADDSDNDLSAVQAQTSSHRNRGRSRHHHARIGDDPDDDPSEDEDKRLWPDHVGGAFSRPPLSTSTIRKRGKARLKRRRGRRSDDSLSSATSLKIPSGDLAHHNNSVAKASQSEGKVDRKDAADVVEEATARHMDSDWSTEDSTVSTHLNLESAEVLVDAVYRRRATPGQSDVNTAKGAEPDTGSVDHEFNRHAIEAKHSLALSTKRGVNGEPLIQTVATLHSELVEVLECQLCYLLLYDPLTTPCGHTFCKSCFARSLDHGDRCPLCRAEMPNFSFFQDHRPNNALLKILTSDTATFSDEDALGSDSTQQVKNAATYAGISVAVGTGTDPKDPKEGDRNAGYIINDDPESVPHHYGFKRLYEQRKSAIEQEEREARLSTPIFVCTLAFPGMPTILHIFEPRYRLMVRRCLESGNPRFGMVLPSRTNGGTEEYGTMLEIRSVQMLADGRSMLETVGSYRFRLLEKGSLDGYTVGRIERVDDISLEEEAELERAVLLRRLELERKKAAEAVERPRGFPPATPSSSDPLHTQAPDEGDQQPSGAAAAQPEMSQVESDALSIYHSNPQPAGQSVSTRGGSNSGEETDPAATEQDAGFEHEDGMLPFEPVPAEPSIEELTEICISFIETLRSGSAPWLLSRLNHTYGPMPSADEVERLGYWMALVMPIDEHEKAKLLPIRSRRLRLCLVVHWIEQLRQSWWFNSGCTVS